MPSMLVSHLSAMHNWSLCFEQLLGLLVVFGNLIMPATHYTHDVLPWLPIGPSDPPNYPPAGKYAAKPAVKMCVSRHRKFGWPHGNVNHKICNSSSEFI